MFELMWTAFLPIVYLITDQHYCDADFDGIGCWSATLGNKTAIISCPDIAGANTKSKSEFVSINI